MSVVRFFAIITIFAVVAAGWMGLVLSMEIRTRLQDSEFKRDLDQQWGPKVLKQAAPYWAPGESDARSAEGAVAPAVTTASVHIAHEYRYKGVLWYSMFTVDFAAEYTLPATAQAGSAGYFIFRQPVGTSLLDNLKIFIGDRPVELSAAQMSSGRLTVPLDRKAEQVVRISYRTYGRESWLYFPGDAPGGDSYDRGDQVAGGMAQLRNFSLTVTTDFETIDFPGRSPSEKHTAAGAGRKAVWRYESSISSQPMGIAAPDRIDPGPMTARMSFLAPVSLFFFFTVLFTVVILKKIPLHPMHYLFIAAGFFAFHILLAYLVDHVYLHTAFWICAAVSVALVVSYMRLVAGAKFALSYVAIAQLVYLIGFSYAFFWKGYTGLTVVVGAILTLFVLMQATGRVDWREILRKPAPQVEQPPAPPIQEDS